MTQRQPEYIRPYSAEYLAVCGRQVSRMFDGPFREYVDAGYVSWLEAELTRARVNAKGEGNGNSKT